ncbi:MAG: type II toxin-antitoxin system VapC family toxin [Acetobacteraceae bacterium]
MSRPLYLDASVLVGLWVETDVLSVRARTLLQARPSVVIISDFASTEFASAIARLVRLGELPKPSARDLLRHFDAWRSRAAQLAEITPSDIGAADRAIRRLDLTLRAPDAIHLAIADRLGAELATFDTRMAACARTLGVVVA